MTPALPPTVSSPAGYVLLRADDLRLLLPQSDVGAAQYVEGALEPVDDAGLFALPNDESGAFYVALASAMTPLKEAPTDRFFSTTLGEGAEALHWCWNEVRVLGELPVTPQPLPAALRAPYSPIAEFALLDEQIVFFTTANQLTEFAFARRT